jgi:hypothetical protein
MKGDDLMKFLSVKLGVVLVGLSFLMIAGCATPFSDLVRSKQEGKGKSIVYKVSVDQAWEIARRVLEWKGVEDINENRSEGYMIATSGATLLYTITEIGIWIEPIDKGRSKVTAITRSKTTVDTFLDISEKEFHEGFALFLPSPEIKPKGGNLD